MERAKNERVGARAHRRFSPDRDSVAKIQFTPSVGEFSPELMALITDESFAGCGLLAFEPGEKVQRGQVCIAAVGKFEPVEAEIIWRKDLPDGVVRFGLRYLTDDA